ncbi:RNA polymerase sigma-70 factor, ECF subfamily [Fontimonas thermophila]|uniref:RNA polymerase sigma-70 factor, ECF subfamily n=1 Tax=Fontimonas thermophila TaxID=1076937 RepID=A0A1I2KHK8_9GAMM|nr:RNA polymerase factor sigma-70 [Fontimonas thermophila]SFF65963.1 RNA polymerase sigma-70 factor, ECF subfamily [Fontimonas thermophila]
MALSFDESGVRSSDEIAWMRDAAFLETLRRQMLKFATQQLSDTHLAEDAVQEAFIGAMKNAQKFAGRAAFKTWVFAILKNKIADALRQRHRAVEVSQLPYADDEEDNAHQLFDHRGFWQADEQPKAWMEPETAIKNAQFWRVFEVCLEHLPGRQGRVFMMREFIELETNEICAALGLTVSNVNVMLHRARLRLRKCLEKNWFVEGESC